MDGQTLAALRRTRTWLTCLPTGIPTATRTRPPAHVSVQAAGSDPVRAAQAARAAYGVATVGAAPSLPTSSAFLCHPSRRRLTPNGRGRALRRLDRRLAQLRPRAIERVIQIPE